MSQCSSLPPLLLSVRQAAELLAVSIVTIRRMTKDGRLPFVRVTRAVRIPHDAIRALATPSGAYGGVSIASAKEDDASSS